MNEPIPGGPFRRPLGFWSGAALVVGHTIGVGVFLIIAFARPVAALAGFAVVLAGLLVFAFARRGAVGRRPGGSP